MKKQLYRAAAATVLGLSLTTGIVAADAGNNIDHTGPSSTNSVTKHVTHDAHITNDNYVTLTNSNTQTGYSGAATTANNTEGGDATSGDVKNDNYTSADVTVDNSWASTMSDPQSSNQGGNGGSISYTGPNSSNTIDTEISKTLEVQNSNNITITNTNSQTGTSGDATVTNNTTGGSATSGNVSNTNTSKFTINVAN